MNDDNKNFSNIIQNIILENRKKMNISGVRDVLSFDDQIVIMDTELGMLTVKGENLKINKLSLDTSEIVLEGVVDSISYTTNDLGKRGNGGSILSKIFK